MASIQLSGLASGFDWQSLVNQLIAAEQAPVTALKNQKTAGSTKSTALNNIQTTLTNLQTTMTSFTSGSVFAGRSAKIADSTSTWSATAAAGTATGDYTFDVTRLATKTQRSGAAAVGAGISSTSDVSGVTLATMNLSTAVKAGDFTVNGNKVTVATTDSLQSVFQKISTATSGTVTGSYDPGTDKINLTSTSGSLVLGSGSDTSNILAAFKLYNNGTSSVSSERNLGVVNTSAALTNAKLKTAITNVDGSGNGTFSINGVAISYNVNSDSLQSIMNKIGTSAAGVTAKYDPVADKFSLVNKNAGNTGLVVNETAGGLMEAMGLNSTSTFQAGVDAQFSINGGPTLTSSSNTFDSNVTGITGLSVTATSVSSQSITVAADTGSARSKIEEFISKYNAVQSYIDSQTKTTKDANGKTTVSTLTNNLDVVNLSRSLRGMVFGATSTLTGSVKRLADIGIDFDSGSSQLSIKDSSKLNEALKNKASDVEALFNDSSSGVATKVNAYITSVTGTNGLIANQTGSITKQALAIDEQIARLNRRIDAEKARLTASFVAMENAQSTLQSQSKALTNAFPTK